MSDSNKWSKRGKDVWAQGYCGTNSKRPTQYTANAPQFFVRAQGPYAWDVDGKRYIDFVGGLGAIILGHNHPKVAEAVHAQMATGYISGSLPTTLEIETAELVQQMFPACEKIRFLKNGDDATRAAVRIARSYTDHEMIHSTGYHGSSDLWTSLTPPAIGVKDKFFINQGGQRACTIVEPINLKVDDMNKLSITSLFETDRFGLIVFDEIITGCRVPDYSVHKWWGLQPDIVCLGKAIANGFPLSIVGGKKEIMDAKEYFISTTFSGEAIALAACKATLTELKKKSMKDLWYYANRFQTKFNELCGEIGVTIEGYGTRGKMDLTKPEVALFCQEACKAGLFFGKAFFFNFSHMESGLEDQIFSILNDIVSLIRLGKCKYEGELPKQPFVR